jgi:predicted nuclease with TOPRIM domain
MAESADAPSERRRPDRTKRRRIVVWALIALASLLLFFSITANWVQTELLDTDEVTATTDEIVTNDDVEEQLSIYLTDQVFATVDVQGQLEERLPPPAQPLAAPIGVAVRGLANDVARRALADPRVQNLIVTAVERSHRQFVALVEDESAYVTRTGGEVVLQYGDLVADLAARLGLDPDTIADIRSIVQSVSQELRTKLTDVQTQIQTVRTGLADAQEGPPSTELVASLTEFQARATALQGAIAGVEEKIKGVEDKVPSALEDRVTDLRKRLAGLDARISELKELNGAVIKDPTSENIAALDARLAPADELITAVLERPAVQTPGELVVMDSTQLDAVQSIVSALRNLGFILPLLVLALYAMAILLAKGWRSQALIGVGCGILAATLLILMALRLAGGEVVSALSKTDTVEPAVQAVWDTISDGLRERARFILIVGLGFVVAGLIAGPGRYATAVRRWLAPHLRDHPAAAYVAVAALFLLWLAFIPGINNLGQVLTIILLAVLAVVGVEALRRQTAREFPQR